MNFKKLALAAAVAVAPMSALALEPMQDDALSAVTGQDGINIGITTNDLSLDVIVHDKDGLNASGLTGDSGAIVIEGMAINTNGSEIEIDIDADGNGGPGVLNVGVTLPDNIEIQTGAISVADSSRVYSTPGDVTSTVTGAWGYTGTAGKVLKNTTITLGETNLNIQLGNEVQTYTDGAGATQTAMIKLDTTIGGGITLTDGGLLDGSASATEDTGILFDSLVIQGDDGAGSTTDLYVDAAVNVESDGLKIYIAELGDQTSGLASLRITNQRLGTATSAALGDIEITGLNLGGTSISIAGK